jgi:hypothetical protein
MACSAKSIDTLVSNNQVIGSSPAGGLTSVARRAVIVTSGNV